MDEMFIQSADTDDNNPVMRLRTQYPYTSWKAVELRFPDHKWFRGMAWWKQLWGLDIWVYCIPLIKTQLAVFVVGELVRWW